jgi:hypothetical protein
MNYIMKRRLIETQKESQKLELSETRKARGSKRGKSMKTIHDYERKIKLEK